MGHASFLRWINKEPDGIRYKRSMVMPLSKAVEARREAAESLARKSSGQVVETVWSTSSEANQPQLSYGIRMATAAEIMHFGTSA